MAISRAAWSFLDKVRKSWEWCANVLKILSKWKKYSDKSSTDRDKCPICSETNLSTKICGTLDWFRINLWISGKDLVRIVSSSRIWQVLVWLCSRTIRESSRDSWSYERMLGAVVKIGKVSMSATRSRGNSGLTVREKRCHYISENQ